MIEKKKMALYTSGSYFAPASSPHISNAIPWAGQDTLLALEELGWKAKESNKLLWKAYTQKGHPKKLQIKPKGQRIQTFYSSILEGSYLTVQFGVQ